MTTGGRFGAEDGDKGSTLMYHARMFALAMLGGVALFLILVGVVVIGLWLGVWHIYDR